MTAPYWRRDDVFRLLCDLVASDTLVCVTGAGISSRLPQKADPAKTLPGWPALLEQLFATLGSRLSSQDRQDCERLLRIDPESRQLDQSSPEKKQWPTGRDLILTASILRAVAPTEFDTAFRTAVTNADGSYSETHQVVLDLQPAGILTFNYDSGHENAGSAANRPLMPILPGDELALRAALTSRARPFYLKAHGSLSSAAELVLTEASYRELFVRAPAYRAFVQNVLTNFNLVFVGFRLSDPDFDLFVDTMANQFGSPLHDHVAVFHQKDRTVHDIALRRRYGIHVLYVNDFRDIPPLLKDTLSQPGPRLEKSLERALSRVHPERTAAHRELAALGPTGRHCASNALRARIDEFTTTQQYFELSEVAYALGVLNARANKAVLMDLVERDIHVDVAGRALTVLRPVLQMDDLDRLRGWLERHQNNPAPGPHADRISKYLDYLLTYVPAKHRSI